MKEKIMEIENVAYSYDGKKMALDGVSFQIEQGEKVAFLGANGSGKSTMFLCLNGVLKPNSGRIKFRGETLSYSKKGLREIRSKVGIVFQEPDDQLFSASVYQEISFGVINLGYEEKEVRKRVDLVMKTLDMETLKDRPTHFLSGGEKKRVTIADIVVMEPEVIIFDEPASALDPKHTEVVYEIIDELQSRGTTVILSTHDVDHAYRWADKIVVFHEGKILMAGSPTEVFTRKEVLEKANLKKPFVMELYERLSENGWKKEEGTYPKTMDEIEQYIRTKQRK